jgi:hypothetical protein
MQDQDCLKSTQKIMGNASTNAKGQNIEDDSIDITLLIRSLQRVEGNFDCFRRAKEYCDQTDCCWREYCLKEAPKNSA